MQNWRKLTTYFNDLASCHCVGPLMADQWRCVTLEGGKSCPSIWTLLLMVLASFVTSCQQPSGTEEVADPKPNILFIMADDHTTQAISAYGGHLAEYAQTTNIDQLAEEGMRFDQVFCTNAICSPSRASVLTGKYSHKNGVRKLRDVFDGSQWTVQKAFQANGYQTALYGKWHLISRPVGFDDYKVLPVQGRYQDPQFYTPGNDSLVTYEGWSTDVITDMSIDFLDNRTRDKPFLLMTHYKTTHDPWASRPPYDTLWQHTDLPAPPNLLDQYEERSAAAHRTTLKLEMINQGTFPHQRLEGVDDLTQRQFIYQQYIKSFLRCGRVLDENVGKLMTYLKQEGLYDNTIIIYTADQGHFLGEHGFFSKRFMYEEALQMPLIIRYPPWIASGSINNDIILNVDYAPTLLEMAGLEVPGEVQGRSFHSQLHGQTPEDWRQAMYYHYWQHILHRDVTAHIGIRTKEHKLIFYYGLPLDVTDKAATPPEWEMFDLENDPEEMRNVYNQEGYLEVTARLKDELKALQVALDDEGLAYPEMVEVQREHFMLSN
ncbi:MAG: sulfatase [Bacteroidota bacterium]